MNYKNRLQENNTGLQEILTKAQALPKATELPTLTNPATAADIASGHEAIDGDGVKMVGTVPEYNEGDIFYNRDTVDFAEENGVQYVVGIPQESALLRPNSVVFSEVPTSWMGDAQPEDVAAGKMFSSSAGFRQVGTAQVGGGVETVNMTFTIYGNGTIYYMGTDGIATLASPYEQTVAVVKDSPVIIIYDGSTTLVLQYGSGYTRHYDNAWSYSGHSCSILSFYEDGDVLYAES